MRDHLALRVDSILDIVYCIGGITVLLWQKYKICNPRIYLLDRTLIADWMWYGFQKEGAYYNSLDIAKQVQIQNGVPSDNVFLIEAKNTGEIDIDDKVDLVVSTLSWGFHYPVEYYLEEICEALSSRGILIVDIRKEPNGIELLKQGFSEVTVINEKQKALQVRCRR